MHNIIRTIFYYPKSALFVLLILSSANAFAQPLWTQVVTPNPSPTRSMLRGISGTSSSDIWAVGVQQTSPPMSAYSANTLVLHWDGNGWQQYTTPNPGVTQTDLYEVEMVSPSEGWACGIYNVSGSSGQGILMKWDGNSWLQHSIPDPDSAVGLWALDAIDSSDVWVVGWGANKVAYSAHYDGSSWTRFHVPKVGAWRNQFEAVDGIAANDVWAVGSYNIFAAGDIFPLAMHWDGATWINVQLPATVAASLGYLQAVKMVSANDVWAIGSFLTGGIIMLHYDGITWTEVPTPGGGGALAVVSANNIWAVGEEIVHWDGTSWTKIDSLTNHISPSLISTVVLPNGDIWAAGRDADSSLNAIFTTLVYRLNNTPTIVPNYSKDNGGLVVFPNPVIGKQLNIAANTNEGLYSLKLLNSIGQVVLSLRKNLSQSISTIDLPANIIPGIYTLSLEKDKIKMEQQIMIR